MRHEDDVPTGSVGSQYDTTAWLQRAAVGKQILVWKLFREALTFESWRLVDSEPERQLDGCRVLASMWTSEGESGDVERLMQVQIDECPSWRGALSELAGFLSECQAASLPEAATRGVEIGDVAYTGVSDVFDTVFAARANVALEVRSVGRDTVSVEDPARRLDGLFTERPRPTEHPVNPTIRSFEVDKPVISRGERVALHVRASDPLERPLWYQFFTNLGEFFIEDDRPGFLSNLPGTAEIQVFARNENGLVAQSSLEVRVE